MAVRKKGPAPKEGKQSATKSTCKKAIETEEQESIFSSTKVKTLFSITKEEANNAKTVTLAGDFNNWDKEITVMKYDCRAKIFKAEIELEKGVHQFRYVFDGKVWGNDPKYPTEENDLGVNSIIEVK